MQRHNRRRIGRIPIRPVTRQPGDGTPATPMIQTFGPHVLKGLSQAAKISGN